MIVTEKQGETYHALNVENSEQGQGYVEVLHFTDPSGLERVEVRVGIYANTTADWRVQVHENVAS